MHDRLLRCFREDHANLGRSFFRLGERLRARDLEGARELARQIDGMAGAHIGFEEESLYPAVASHLEGKSLADLIEEHRAGADALATLIAAESGTLPDAVWSEIEEKSSTMREHIEACADLFTSVLELDPEEQESLYRSLLEWRRKQPTWLSLVSRRIRSSPEPSLDER